MRTSTSSVKMLTLLLQAAFMAVLALSYTSTAYAAPTSDPATVPAPGSTASTQNSSATTNTGTTNAASSENGTAVGFTPLTALPGIQDAANATTLPAFLNQVYKICIGVAAVLAVLYIMYAGVEFMTSRGSVTSNEKAKAHIQNAILGLILVLSPTIVFGIINPDILKLDFTDDISKLKPDALQHVDTSPSVSGTTDNGSTVPQNCSAYSNEVAVPLLQACSLQGSTYVQVATSCCAGIQSGHSCCARPVNSSTAQSASSEYMWRVSIAPSPSDSTLPTNPLETPQPTVRQDGPFDTQQKCLDSYAAFTNFDTSKGAKTVQCDCSKPRSEFAACKQ